MFKERIMAISGFQSTVLVFRQFYVHYIVQPFRYKVSLGRGAVGLFVLPLVSLSATVEQKEEKKKKATTRIRTGDLLFTRQAP